MEAGQGRRGRTQGREGVGGLVAHRVGKVWVGKWPGGKSWPVGGGEGGGGTQGRARAVKGEGGHCVNA